MLQLLLVFYPVWLLVCLIIPFIIIGFICIAGFISSSMVQRDICHEMSMRVL